MKGDRGGTVLGRGNSGVGVAMAATGRGPAGTLEPNRRLKSRVIEENICAPATGGGTAFGIRRRSADRVRASLTSLAFSLFPLFPFPSQSECEPHVALVFLFPFSLSPRLSETLWFTFFTISLTAFFALCLSLHVRILVINIIL